MDAKEKTVSDASPSEKRKASKEEAKKRTAAFLKNVFFGAVYALCGYFLGGTVLPYGAMPLGVAFLCAADRRVFYAYAGLVLSAVGRQDRVLIISVYTAVLAVRMLTRLLIDPPWRHEERHLSGERTVAEIYPHLFSENIGLRMASSAVGAFAIGVYRLIEGGLTYYDMYGTVISTVGAPLAVLLAGGFFSRSAGKYRRLTGFIAIAFGVIYAIGEQKLYGISLAAFGCMLVTLFLARKGGAILGIISGALLGLAISIELVPLFAFSGLVFGMLCPISAIFATGGALSVALAWGVYVQGIGVLNGLASAIVSSALIFGIWDKLFNASNEATEEAEDVPTEKRSEPITLGHVSKIQLSDTEGRVSAAGDSLASMSETLYEISDKLQSPNAADLRQICDSAFDYCCAGCENKSACWSERYRQTSEALGDLCASLHKNGSVSVRDVSPPLSDNCGRLPEILSEINHNAGLYVRQMAESDRTELFALDYGAIAELFSATVRTDPEEYLHDSELWDKISEKLKAENIPVTEGCVLGKRQKRIALFFKSDDDARKYMDESGKILSEVCPFELEAPEIIENEKESSLRFCESERFSAGYAQKSLLAEGEDKYCGDTSGIFKSRDGKLCAFISDGMGSGREAALTSGLCGLFLRKFLSGGCSCEGVLKLLNGFLRNRGGGSLHECSATVDIMELDLYTGRAEFFKSGAAPTYVFRNGSLFKLRSHTVPVGIIKELDLRQIDFELNEGDLIVMVSDGVTDGREECPWLFDLLRSQGENATPDRLAELVVKYAKAEGASDDISVLVIRLQSKAFDRSRREK